MKTRFQRWWELNKDEINRKRRLKYRKDPVYRSAQVERAREYRRRMRDGID